jgi:hypothetical protein
MLVFDFFAGTGSSTRAFADAGHRVITFELDPQFEASHTIDIMDLEAGELFDWYGQPDFVWASPPCTAFSVASMGYHWTGGSGAYIPKTEAATYNQGLVWKTRHLIHELQPMRGYLIENPRGMLRKLNPVQGLPRHTITYCQYGDDRMKPTDLWGEVPGWQPRPMCKNGDPCHTPAPRGSKTGTQGRTSAKERSMIPYELGKDILEAIS